ncbi:Replication-associated protein G2P, partial [Escherichia coli]|nr:Replication-associated protein G2P [Escherichia coli]
MIDWFTGILPCTHRPLPAGSVVSVDADGAVEWETVKRLTVRGSHESTMKVRSVGSDGEGRATHLYIDGNPSKFLQGHSVIGSDDLQGLVLTAYARILALLHIPHDLPSYRQVMKGQFKISRIDINYMYSLSTLENVRAWLYAAEFKAKTRHGRACSKGGTVYLGKNSRRWSLKFYSKYDEHTSGKKGHQMADEFVKAGLLDWSKDKLRIELTLRTTELIDLNLTLGNSWNIETPNKLFSDYVGRI